MVFRFLFVPVLLLLVTDMLRLIDKEIAEKFATSPGNPYRTIYSEKVNSDGSISLVEVGKENINDIIQAYKDSTDIAQIVAYYNSTGDESVLNRMVPQYGDFTELPKSFADMLQLRIDSLKFFEALPVDVRQKFNNDANVFFSTAGSKDWIENLGPVIDKYGSKDKPIEPIEPIKESAGE